MGREEFNKLSLKILSEKKKYDENMWRVVILEID